MKMTFENNGEEKTSGSAPEKHSLLSLFSYHGSIGRLEFLGTIVLLNLLINAVSRIDSLILNILVYFVVFYLLFAAVQKRCRDIHIKGTFVILLFSLGYLCIQLYTAMDGTYVSVPQILKFTITGIAIIYFICLVFLLVFPGKTEKNFTSTSPLLKYPLLYTGIFFTIFLIGISFINYQLDFNDSAVEILQP